MKAVRMHEPGPPEVLKLEEVETPTPGPGEVLVKVEVAGVNYADTGMRRGMFGGPHGPAKLPATPGFEVAGTVAATGEGVEGFAEGDRVAAVLERGGYAGYAVAPVMTLVRVPEGVKFSQSMALLVQGITAYGVLHDSARLQKGETVLVMAAAGGVGHLAVQLAKLAGAGKVIAAAGSDEKRELALNLGADHAIDYTRADWTDRVREATGGRGVDVVLESVGGELGSQAYATLAPLGRFVTFGAASGPPSPPDMTQLAFQGLAVMGFGGPWVRPGRAQAARAEISGYLKSGELRVVADRTYPLAEAHHGPPRHRRAQDHRQGNPHARRRGSVAMTREVREAPRRLSRSRRGCSTTSPSHSRARRHEQQRPANDVCRSRERQGLHPAPRLRAVGDTLYISVDRPPHKNLRRGEGGAGAPVKPRLRGQESVRRRLEDHPRRGDYECAWIQADEPIHERSR